MSNEEKNRQRNLFMIETQLKARRITAQAVLDAFAKIDRSLFVPKEYSQQAYEDSPLPIGHGQTISQPYIVALSLQELAPMPEQKVLDVGAGSGYQTALLSCLAGEIHGIERIEPLAEQAAELLGSMGISNAHIHVGDGSLGLAEYAPFDRIICAAASPEVPKAWLDQLPDGGRIVLPVGGRDTQTLLRIDKIGDKIVRHEICCVRFVPLLGEQGWQGT